MNRIAKRAFPGLFSACALACAMGAAMLAGVPAQAQGPASEPGGYYRAELATPLAAPRQEILDGVLWRCAGNACTGTKSGSRTVMVCGRLAGRIGPIAAFTDPKGALSADDLARCNQR